GEAEGNLGATTGNERAEHSRCSLLARVRLGPRLIDRDRRLKRQRSKLRVAKARAPLLEIVGRLEQLPLGTRHVLTSRVDVGKSNARIVATQIARALLSKRQILAEQSLGVTEIA